MIRLPLSFSPSLHFSDSRSHLTFYFIHFVAAIYLSFILIPIPLLLLIFRSFYDFRPFDI